jgi:hypothetical protein
MVDIYEQLGLIAEIAATLLGFIAVFLALSKDNGRFSESDRHFIQAMVLCCSYAILFGLAPGTLSKLLEETRSWELALYAALVGAIIVTCLIAWEQAQMSREESQKVHWLWHAPPWTMGCLANLMLILALVNRTEIAAYYVIGLALMIGISLWCFITIVFRRFF